MSENVSILDCNWDKCTVEQSWYGYQPGLAMNVALLVLFSIGLILHLGMGIIWKTWGFWIAFSMGCALEVFGYAGRIISHYNPWSLPGFLIQIDCLALAPAFFAAGLYLCLARIVITYGANISSVQPKVYTYIFVLCDFLALAIQGTGGGMSSTSAKGGNAPDIGGHITLAGICVQVVTISCWMALCTEFALRCKKVGKSAWDPAYESLRSSFRFKGFLCALGLGTLTVYIRSIYRIAELSQGYGGPLARDETAFCVLEGVMIVITTFALAIFHPGLSFGKSYTAISAQKKGYPRPWKRGSIFTKKEDLVKPIRHLASSSTESDIEKQPQY